MSEILVDVTITARMQVVTLALSDVRSRYLVPFFGETVASEAEASLLKGERWSGEVCGLVLSLRPTEGAPK